MSFVNNQLEPVLQLSQTLILRHYNHSHKSLKSFFKVTLELLVNFQQRVYYQKGLRHLPLSSIYRLCGRNPRGASIKFDEIYLITDIESKFKGLGVCTCQWISDEHQRAEDYTPANTSKDFFNFLFFIFLKMKEETLRRHMYWCEWTLSRGQDFSVFRTVSKVNTVEFVTTFGLEFKTCFRLSDRAVVNIYPSLPLLFCVPTHCSWQYSEEVDWRNDSIFKRRS